MRIFLTGGTGFLGGFIAEAAITAGHQVRALARPTSDVAFLEGIGAEIVRGDLGDATSLKTGADGCEVIVHAAAKVMDWGPWEDYYAETVTASRRVYDAAVAAGVSRAVHVSSVAVYGKESVLAGDVDESMGPVPEAQLSQWYYYGRAKSLAEQLAMEYHAAGTLPMSVVRPAWIYGPRDRASLPRLLTMLERGRVMVIGDGDNELSLTYAANVADAILLAATKDEALGEAFNISNDGHVTQRQYVDALADMLNVSRPTRSMPYRVGLTLALVLESVHRGLHLRRRPIVTRQGIQLIALPSTFTTEKIRSRLGWKPRIDFATALTQVQAWWKAERARLQPGL